MAINKGFLTCDTTEKGDEVFTPFYAVDPIIKYIPLGSTIWLPFDESWSAFNQMLREKGFNVINSNLRGGQDFFKYQPENYDIIISNPPFSKKDEVIKRLYELNKPFAILLPMNSLQGKKRFKYFKKGIQILCFDSRVDYHTNKNYKTYTKGNHFGSAYFCKDFLPKDLIMEELIKYERPLK